jgi:hypothetical protein
MEVNGTHIFGRHNWKITEMNALPEKAVFFDRLERFKRNLFCSIYTFSVLVPGSLVIDLSRCFGNEKRLFRTRFSS